MNLKQDPYVIEQVKALGFDPDKLTENQVYILVEPVVAPENYHHDGEVTSAQAKEIWRKSMKNHGFTPLQIFNAERKMGL